MSNSYVSSGASLEEDAKQRAILENEARNKYLIFSNSDPFPAILPSLLNSADIYDYVNTTGMICPFYTDNLKSASYGIKLKGDFIYWENSHTRKFKRLEYMREFDENGERVFILKKNSIAFVQLEPTFRIPSYIAARFNLKIKHIYQGILLGTGPLVDPGYEGNIYVPLHNLTNNDYKINIDKPLIWMDFTKLSTNEEWDKNFTREERRIGKYKPFDKSRLKTKQTLSEYLNDAFPNAPILSTIGGIIEANSQKLNDFEKTISDQQKSIEKSVEGTTKITSQFNYSVIVALIAIVLTASYTIYQTVTIHSRTLDYMKEYDKKIDDKYLKLDSQKIIVKELQEEVNQLKKKK